MVENGHGTTSAATIASKSVTGYTLLCLGQGDRETMGVEGCFLIIKKMCLVLGRREACSGSLKGSLSVGRVQWVWGDCRLPGTLGSPSPCSLASTLLPLSHLPTED